MMSSKPSWITPFMKQCYVTSGVSLNMASHGFVAGFTAVLLPQLRTPESSIQVDELSESWIASIFGISFVFGNLINPVAMDKCGRKKTNLFTIAIMAAAWYMTVWAPSIPWLLVCRLIQGLALGFTIHLCPIMIAEYTSPRNRGGFLATVAMAISCGVLIIHSLGSFLHWRTASLICAIIMTFDFIIALSSPETPSWLLKEGRYDECKSVFRWLRGSIEEEELEAMIEANATKPVSKTRESFLKGVQKNVLYFKRVMTKREFYKPIFTVVHLYMLGVWGGTTIISQFTPDIFLQIVGGNIDPGTMTVVLTTHRFISGIYMTFVMRKFKRRSLLILTTMVTIISLLANAGFAYSRQLLHFEYPVIGVILIHIHMVSICSGGVTLGFIIAGELFPLEYRSLAGGISAIFFSVNLFIISKTTPYLFTNLGIPVAYCIYAFITAYCLIIIWTFLPETKDRTLQEIEDGFRMKKSLDEEETTEPLNSG